MRPTSNFKMSGTTKAMLALMPFKDQHDRASFKRAMIQAQLAAEVAGRAKLDKSAREE